MDVVGFATICPMPERVQLARHGGCHWKFQHCPCVLKGFFELLTFWTIEIDASQLSRIVIAAFPSVELLVTYWIKFLSTNDQAWWLLEFV